LRAIIEPKVTSQYALYLRLLLVPRY